MSKNEHLPKDYAKKAAIYPDNMPGVLAVEFHLPDHKFLPWQQEAYDAIMIGKSFNMERSVACGKTYLANAIREDMKIINKVLEKLDK